MGSFVRNHNSYASSSTSTAISPTTAAAVSVGNLLIALFTFDNISTTTPSISSISKPAGETNGWARLVSGSAHSTTAGAGVRTEIWAIQTTVSWASGTVVGGTLSQGVGARAGFLAEFTGFKITPLSTDSTQGSSGSATCLAGTPAAGTLIIGFNGEGAAGTGGAYGPDSDTAGGAWSTPDWNTAGTSGSGIAGYWQYKIPTSAVSQSFDTNNPGGGFSQSLVVLPSASITAAVTIDTETNAAVPVGKKKVKATTVSSETETAVPVGRTKTKALAPAVEVDSALIFGTLKGRHIVAATVLETDTAQPIQATKSKSLTLASETSVAQVLTRVKLRPLTTTTETQAAIPFGVIDPVRYWRFEPPTYPKAFDWPLLTKGPRFHLDQAMSVVRMGGVLRAVSAPSQDQLVAAGVEGVDWFRGGHIYIVGKAVADDLTANGFTVTFDHEG